MIVDKSYQASADLQAFPNTTITVNKVFLYINQRLLKNPKAKITVEEIAREVKVCQKTVSNSTNELQNKHGMITKSTRPGYWNDVNHYVITSKGQSLVPYLENLYKVVTGIFKRPLLSAGLLLSLGSSSFPLLKEDIYISPLVKRKLLTHARARRVVVSTPIDSKQVLAAQDLLSLSQWGIIRLSAFPKEAIEHANFSFRASKTKKEDPFKWFLGVCDKWCRENNVEPDLTSARNLAKEANMPSRPEWIVPRPVLEIPKKGKLGVGIERKAFSEEQQFIETVHAVDKFKQLEKLGQLSPLQHQVMQNLMKKIQPFMSDTDGSN